MTDFRRLLNPEQFEAATSSAAQILVLAAAGTGKTRTLVHRVAYLAENGVPPSSILLLTFTNRAAREMRERAEQIVPGSGDLVSGTFHSVCARLLRKWAHRVGYGPDFTIIDEDDQKKLMTQCIKDEVGNPKDFVKPALMLKLVSDAANKESDFAEYAASMQSKMAIDPGEAAKVAALYAERKRSLNAMDFDDLIICGLRAVEEHPDVLEAVRARIRHTLVDEYQDTNPLQARFADLVAGPSGGIMAVGDDFQCIYTWRGAAFENIMDFPKRWPGCRIVKLERNYRSTPEILDVANVVMRDAPVQFEKTLAPTRESTAGAPFIVSSFDGRAQAEYITRTARLLHDEYSIPYGDMAVLYRSHYTSIEVQFAFSRASLPFRITSGVGVFEQLHVKDALAFLRLCLSRSDELSFRRVMEMLPGVGEAGVRKCWSKLGGRFDATSAMERIRLGEILPARARGAWESLSQAFGEAAKKTDSRVAQFMVEDFTREFYADHLRRRFDEQDAESRLDDLKEISVQIAAHEGGLPGFLREAALMTNLDVRRGDDGGEGCVQLSTIHQAKGMEWKVVFLPWLVETVFPSPRSVDDGNLDEERRLFYVAVTRAKDRLFLMTPRMRQSMEGGIYEVAPSRFVAEIPPEMLHPKEYRDSASRERFARRGGGDIYGGYGNRYSGRYGGGQAPWKTVWRR